MIHINSYKLTPAITATWGDITGNVSNQEDLVEYINEHGTAAWGSISGNISDQSDLMSTLGSYATESWVSSQQFVTESWVSEQGYLTSSALTGYATESWVSSQQFATQSWVAGQGYLTHVPPFYATVTWVERQGYVNNSQVISIFNDCNPLVYDVSSPFATYLESHSVLKYDDVPEPEEGGEATHTNPLVLGYDINYRPSFGSEVISYTLEVNGGHLFQRINKVSYDSSTGQVTGVEKLAELNPCWIGPNEWPLMMTYPEEETGSPTDMGAVSADFGDYGILIGTNPTGVDGEFEGIRVTPDGVLGRFVVTGEEDEETGEMTYTDETYPFVYGEATGRVIDEFGGIYIKGSSVEIGIDEDYNSSGLRIYDSGQGAEIVKYNIIDDGQGNITTSEQILATQDWVTTQINNSIGSAMSITNQILS